MKNSTNTWALSWGGVWLVAFGCLHPNAGLAQTPTVPFQAATQLGADAEPTFKISRFEIEGPELIPRAKLMEVLSAFQGRLITFGELRTATQAVEKLHALAGFELVRVLVPEQDIEADQPLRLMVADAKLDVVAVSGNQFFSAEHIAAQLTGLQEGGTVNTELVDKNLRLINENPSRIVRVTLEPSDKPLMVDAKVGVADAEPLAFYASLDNTGTHATGDYRLGLVAQHNNVGGRAHQLSAQMITSPTQVSDVQVYGLSYRIPLTPLNGLLEFNASHSNVRVGNLRAGNSALNVTGSGNSAGVRWTQLLNRLNGLDQRVQLSFDYKNFDSDVRLEGSANSLLPNVGSRPITLAYQLLSKEEATQAYFNASYSKNSETSGRNSQAQYRQANPFAVVDFDIFRVNTSYTMPWFDDWRFSASVDAQYSSDTLISGEQFGAGGVYSVRGFEERVISADSGVRASLEAQTGNRNSWVKDWLPRVNFVTFVDAATLKVNRAPGAPTTSPALASVGAGVRFAFRPEHQFKLDLARVITGLPTQPSGDLMLHFSFISVL